MLICIFIHDKVLDSSFKRDRMKRNINQESDEDSTNRCFGISNFEGGRHLDACIQSHVFFLALSSMRLDVSFENHW